MEEGLVWWEPMAECSNGVRRRARSEDMGGEWPDGDLPPSDVGVEVDLPPPPEEGGDGEPYGGARAEVVSGEEEADNAEGVDVGVAGDENRDHDQPEERCVDADPSKGGVDPVRERADPELGGLQRPKTEVEKTT